MNKNPMLRIVPVALSAFLIVPGVSSATASGGATLTTTQITEAISADTLGDLLQGMVGTPPTDSGIADLNALLSGLVASNPALAAQVANGVASLSRDMAAEDPATAVALAKIAVSAIESPAVQEAAPEQAGATLVTLAGAMRLATRSAATKGIDLDGADQLNNEIDDLAGSAAILAAVPDIASSITESIQLADAQADLAGFTTAAGPGDFGDPANTTGLSEFVTAAGVDEGLSPIQQ